MHFIVIITAVFFFCIYVIFLLWNLRVEKSSVYGHLIRIARLRVIHYRVWFDDPSSILFIYIAVARLKYCWYGVKLYPINQSIYVHCFCYIYKTKRNWRWTQLRIIYCQLFKCFNWKLTTIEEDSQCCLFWINISLYSLPLWGCHIHIMSIVFNDIIHYFETLIKKN